MRAPLLLLALPALLLAACGGSGPGDRPHVLLITVDTLRADRLGCYGYGRETSPNLDAFAREAVRFENAYSHAPFTAPSHASLLTGLHTRSHGVVAWAEELTPEALTMGERLDAVGFRTGAFYNHPGLQTSKVWRGFEEVQLRTYEEVDLTVDAYLEWFDAGEGPSAVWMHLWDVHRPYGFRDWRPPYLRERVDRDELTLAFEEQTFGQGNPQVGRTEGHYNLNAAKRASVGLTAEDYRYIEDRYDGGVLYADRGLGRLFDELRARGVLDDMVVVVTSDHGESLTERDPCYFTHDPFLYEETLRVPLLVRLPGGAHGGAVVDTLARGVDVLPTILEAADVAPRGNEQGRSLLAVVRGDDTTDAPLLAETRTKNPKEFQRPRDVELGPDDWYEFRRALRYRKWKLHEDVSAGTYRLFDLEADPGETRDLYEEPLYRQERDQMRTLLAEIENRLPEAGLTSGEIAPDILQALEAAGYVDGDED